MNDSTAAVWMVGLGVIFAMTLTLALTYRSVVVNTIAIQHGLCEVMNEGSGGTHWGPCRQEDAR